MGYAIQQNRILSSLLYIVQTPIIVEPENRLHHELVEEVKRVQHTSEQWRQAWHVHCDTFGGGVRDPLRHDALFLMRFLVGHIAPSTLPSALPLSLPSSVPIAVSTATSQHEEPSSIAMKVKQLQRLSVENRDLWHKLCDEERNGVRDPNRHDDAFLHRFVEIAGQGSSICHQPEEATSELVSEVKLAQKNSPEWREAWHQFCDTENSGIRDPVRHSKSSLRRFLDGIGLAAGASLKRSHNGSATNDSAAKRGRAFESVEAVFTDV